jgi:hemoglobin
MKPNPRIDLSAVQIDKVVAVFYAKVRRDPTLGPVFAGKVSDWSSHETKIAAFWRNAILHERSYSGNPMRKHMQAGTVKDGHFPIWLALFDGVLAAQLPVDVAAGWSALAHRIGAGLRFGLTMDSADGVPNLR